MRQRAARPTPDAASNVGEQIGHYRRLAARFDRSVWSLGRRDNRNHAAKIEAMAEAIRAAEGGRVLEVGTGTGLHARWLLERTPVEYVGVDASAAMLRIAGTRLGPAGDRARFGIADAHRLPFDDESFDSAFCSGTLHHLSDPARGLRELARVVRRGGRVAAMEPNWKFPSVLLVGALNRAERNVFKISPARLLAWTDGLLEDVEVRPLLFTPPLPRTWARFYDRVDARLERVPGLRQLSIMTMLSGRRA